MYRCVGVFSNKEESGPEYSGTIDIFSLVPYPPESEVGPDLLVPGSA